MRMDRNYINAIAGAITGSMPFVSLPASSTFFPRTFPTHSFPSPHLSSPSISHLSTVWHLMNLTHRRVGSITMMSLNLSKYYQTLHVKNGSQLLWSSATFTWPNFLSLIASAVTFLGAVVVLIAYCRGRAHAERVDNHRARVAKIVLVLEIAAALTSAVAMYKTRGNGNSLSGQTCGAPEWKTPMFPQVDFDRFCLMQVIPRLSESVLFRGVSLFSFVRSWHRSRKRSQGSLSFHVKGELTR